MLSPQGPHCSETAFFLSASLAPSVRTHLSVLIVMFSTPVTLLLQPWCTVVCPHRLCQRLCMAHRLPGRGLLPTSPCAELAHTEGQQGPWREQFSDSRVVLVRKYPKLFLRYQKGGSKPPKPPESSLRNTVYRTGRSQVAGGRKRD